MAEGQRGIRTPVTLSGKGGEVRRSTSTACFNRITHPCRATWYKGVAWQLHTCPDTGSGSLPRLQASVDGRIVASWASLARKGKHMMDRSDKLETMESQYRARHPYQLSAGAGTGISAKCAEAAETDLIIIYNSGRYRMAGRGSLAGLMPYGDANAIVMEMAREMHCPSYARHPYWPAFVEPISTARNGPIPSRAKRGLGASGGRTSRPLG